MMLPQGRIAGTRYWPGGPYTLQAILHRRNLRRPGLICHRGRQGREYRPVFAGSGQDGRHAWFGYLDGPASGGWTRPVRRAAPGDGALDRRPGADLGPRAAVLSERFRACRASRSRGAARVRHRLLRAGNGMLRPRLRDRRSTSSGAISRMQILLEATRGRSERRRAGGRHEGSRLAFMPTTRTWSLFREPRLHSLRGRGRGALRSMRSADRREAEGHRDDLAVMQGLYPGRSWPWTGRATDRHLQRDPCAFATAQERLSSTRSCSALPSTFRAPHEGQAREAVDGRARCSSAAGTQSPVNSTSS